MNPFHQLSNEDQPFIQAVETEDLWNREASQFQWSYEEAYPLSVLGSTESWTAWITEEREILQRELGYDRCAEVEATWFESPTDEPLIIVEIPKDEQDRYGCTFIAWDGAHRIGLAHLKGWSAAPMFVGKLPS